MKMILIVLCLAGCAGGPSVLEGTPRAVVVKLGTDEWGRVVTGPTLAVAEEHCRRYGKHARYLGRPSFSQISYECVD